MIYFKLRYVLRRKESTVNYQIQNVRVKNL